MGSEAIVVLVVQDGIVKLNRGQMFVINKQLLDDVEHDIENYQGRGLRNVFLHADHVAAKKNASSW